MKLVPPLTIKRGPRLTAAQVLFCISCREAGHTYAEIGNQFDPQLSHIGVRYHTAGVKYPYRPRKKRGRIFTLKLEGKNPAQIAEIVGVSTNYVKVTLAGLRRAGLLA